MYAELDEVTSALAPREWRFTAGRRSSLSHAVVLVRGAGEVGLRHGRLKLAGPAFAWIPAGGAEHVRIEAGSSGFVFASDEDMISRAIAATRSSAEARSAFDRVIHLESRELQDEIAAFWQACFSIGRELRETEAGWEEIVSLHLAVVVRLATRLVGPRTLAEPIGADASVLFQRFVQSAELHFREHWSVARHASELGVTERRLHMACVQATKRSPLLLLHQRLAIEAQSQLAETAQPVAQIGFGLGFEHASQFSRFFRRLVGRSAREFRSEVRKSKPREPGYASWP